MLMAALALAGCGGVDDRRSAIAVAKCGLPLAKRLNTDDPGQVGTSDVRVKELGRGRYRVTGLVSVAGKSEVPYVCEVVPDPSDKLRGFRVTLLQVDPPRG